MCEFKFDTSIAAIQYLYNKIFLWKLIHICTVDYVLKVARKLYIFFTNRISKKDVAVITVRVQHCTYTVYKYIL